ncbi:Bifunctional ATP-dependent dihydroxyacetone kinase/FAD-AMP lyase (Cyclizing), partial [Operophtera brumata]
TCVDDNLRGVVATYPSLQLHPKNRVITVRRKDDSKRVAVLGGGGSGHEPFASGFVASGMLDGAVAGGVFASPPTAGVTVIIGNYTGDRLNFGKAIEKAKISGIKVEGLIVGEDVASSMNKTGGRSMVGEVLFYKLSGAMAQKGYELDKIRSIAAEANKFMATLGVCLSASSLPGQPPLFEIAQDEMELGAGVHGEAGIAKMKMGTAKEVVKMIIDKIIAHLKLMTGHRVAVMVDNLGGTSFIEMNIIAAETKEYLDMGDLWLELLDAPTGASGWTGSEMSVRNDEKHLDDETLLQTDGRKAASGPALSPKDQDILRGSLATAAEHLVKSEGLLNKLDSGCGDGDCGITLKKFGHAILSYLETASLEYISNVLWDLSEIADKDMGGTSGGIYSLGLSAAAQAIAFAKSNDAASWLAAWHSAMDAITKYGGAEPGDRTMLDTLHVAAEAFKKYMKEELAVLLKKTSEAAERGAQATKDMTARAGRASYVASGYTRDEDAGARATAVWLQAILHHIASKI